MRMAPAKPAAIWRGLVPTLVCMLALAAGAEIDARKVASRMTVAVRANDAKPPEMPVARLPAPQEKALLDAGQVKRSWGWRAALRRSAPPTTPKPRISSAHTVGSGTPIETLSSAGP